MTIRMPAVWMRGPVGLLVAVLLGLPVAGAGADTNLSRPVGELYEVALYMDAAVLDLNMLLGEEQSKAYSDRMDGTLKKLETAITASSASLPNNGVSGANTSELASNVNAFIKLARINRSATLSTGAPENAVVDEMMQRRRDARKVLDRIYVDLEKRAGFTGSALSEARALALLLEQMAATYVESASAAYVNPTQDSQDATIDQMAKGFSTRLAGLLGRAKGEEATKLGRSIQSKWKFIEHSMLNYQEKTVPFLVDRYAQAIVADLVTLARALDKKE